MFNGNVMKNNVYSVPVHPSGPLSFMQYNTLLAGECNIEIAYEKNAYILINKSRVKYNGTNEELTDLNDRLNWIFDEIKDGFKNHQQGPLYKYENIMDCLKAYFVFYQNFMKQYFSGENSSENKENLQNIRNQVANLNAIIADSYNWTNNTLSHLDNFSVLFHALSSAIRTPDNIPETILKEYNDIKKKKENAIETIKQQLPIAADNSVILRAATGIFSLLQSQNPPCSERDLVEVSLTKLPENTDGVSDYLMAIDREIDWFKKIRDEKPGVYQFYVLVSDNESISNYCTMINEMMTSYYLEIISISADCHILSRRIDRLLQLLSSKSEQLDPFYLNTIHDDWSETILKWQKIKSPQ